MTHKYTYSPRCDQNNEKDEELQLEIQPVTNRDENSQRMPPQASSRRLGTWSASATVNMLGFILRLIELYDNAILEERESHK